jgi:hypothetical protein
MEQHQLDLILETLNSLQESIQESNHLLVNIGHVLAFTMTDKQATQLIKSVPGVI